MKYAGTRFPHERMMPPPIGPDGLGPVDLVLLIHRHADHRDPGTLKPLGERLPDPRFAVPAAETEEALSRTGVAVENPVPLDAGGRVEALPGVAVRAVRAAHGTSETDGAGRHRFLGCCLDIAGVTLFHSGDAISFDGQRGKVAALRADLAPLPVNGRSDALREAGFAGNMTPAEAVSLRGAAGIPAMIAHHHGMFAFNGADPDAIDRAAEAAPPLLVRRARLGRARRLGAALHAG